MAFVVANPLGGPAVRGLVAAHDLFPGDTVLQVRNTPRVLMAKSPSSVQNATNSCTWCFQLTNPELCDGCKVHRYCPGCKPQDRLHIERECHILRHLIDPDDVTRLVVRVYVSCEVDEKYREDLGRLTAHVPQMVALYPALRELTTVVVLALGATSTGRSVWKASHSLTYAWVLRLFCICYVNCNALINCQFEEIGYGLNPAFALINHSCVANTTLVLCQCHLHVVAKTFIPKGTAITTSYCYVNVPAPLRQSILQSRYFFKCECSGCTRWQDYYFSYNCPHCEQVQFRLCFNTILRGSVFNGCMLMQPLVNLQGDVWVCSKCCTPISRTKVMHSHILHRTLLMYLLHVAYTPDEPIFGDSPEELAREFDARAPSYAKHSLVKLFLVLEGFLPRHGHLILPIVAVLLTEGIVPAFCYPVNLFVQSMANDTIEYFPHLTDLELCYKRFEYLTRQYFNVDMAADTNGCRFSKAHIIRNAADALLDTVDAIDFHCGSARYAEFGEHTAPHQMGNKHVATMTIQRTLMTFHLLLKAQAEVDKHSPHHPKNTTNPFHDIVAECRRLQLPSIQFRTVIPLQLAAIPWVMSRRRANTVLLANRKYFPIVDMSKIRDSTIMLPPEFVGPMVPTRYWRQGQLLSNQ